MKFMHVRTGQLEWGLVLRKKWHNYTIDTSMSSVLDQAAIDHIDGTETCTGQWTCPVVIGEEPILFCLH